MGGLQAAAEMRRAGGKARFVVSSGYSNDPVIADYTSYGFDGGLAKPFLIKDLSRLIRQLINAPTS
jgi:DNA-binding NarL/FixJ family response regulator